MTTQPPRNPEIVLIWKFFAFCLLLLVGTVVAAICWVIVFNVLKGMGMRKPDFAALVAMYVFVAINVVIVSAFLVRQFDGLSLRALGLGFDRPWLRHIVCGGVAGGALVTLTWIVQSTQGWVHTQFNVDVFDRLPHLILTLVFCIAIALYEEVVFRGYVFQVAARRNTVLAVVVSGLLFVSIHLWLAGGLEILAMVNTFVVHVLLALCYLKTRSLWLPIGLHSAWNFTECFVFGMPFNGHKPVASIFLSDRVVLNNWTGFDYGPDGGGVVTIVLSAALLIVFFFVKQRTPSPDIMTAHRVDPDVAKPVATPAPTAPVTPALHATSPVKRDRILAIDVLRGISILGILPMNMQLFAQTAGGCMNPYAGAFVDDTNITTFVILRILIGTKDLLVFSMLFGAGVVMLDNMKRTDGQSQAALHFRRMAVILAFGLIHAYAIWFGDILVTYAVCGSLIYPLRKIGPKLQISLGVFIFMIPMLAILALHFIVPQLSDNMIEIARVMFYPSVEEQNAFIDTYRQGWLGQMPARAEGSLVNQTLGVLLCMGPIGAGMMIVGMGMYKLGYLTGKRTDRSYFAMIAIALLVGFPMLLYGFYWSFQHNWALPDGYFLGWFFRETAYPIIVLGWIGATMLICKYGKLKLLTRALAATGQLALSNYLMQSLVCSFIFYGHGLGLVGRVDHLQQIYITLAIWTVQLCVSPLWLKRYHIGPAEWLWRSLTIGDWQCFRRPAARPSMT